MLEFKGLSVTLGKKKILDDISFALPHRQITAVIGRNGSGKSTLLSCLTRETLYTGQILLDGRDLLRIAERERAQKISVLPQSLPRPPLTVGELVSMGRIPYLDIGKRLSDLDKKCIADALVETGLEQLESRKVNTLSGGERQKAYLAMVLAQNTEILLLDEPTTYMDMDNEADFLSLVSDLKENHRKTVLAVMHNLSKAVEIADNILVLDNGRKCFFGSARECVESAVIEEVFGVHKGFCQVDGDLKTIFYR